MVVILRLTNGEAFRLDRNLYAGTVVEQINDGRGKGKLIGFPNDATPSRTVYIDPDHVVSVKNDGYSY